MPRPRTGTESVRRDVPEPVTEAAPPAPGAEPDPLTTPDPASTTGPGPDPTDASQADQDTKAEAAPDTEPEADPADVPKADPAAKPGTDLAAKAGSDPDTAPETEPTPKVAAQSATEPDAGASNGATGAGSTVGAGATVGAGSAVGAGSTATLAAATGKPAAKPGETVIDLDVAPTEPAGRNRRIRVRFAHAVARWPSPGAVRAWSRRPSGRLTLPALLLFALVAATGAAGAFLIPATARQAQPVGADATTGVPTPEPTAPGFTVGPGGLPSGLPSPPSFGTPSVPAPPWNATGGRPSDVLAGWAGQIGPKVGISTTAMQAYGYAELRVTQTTPGCQLRWTTLAAIGQVESGHGRANGAVLGVNGVAAPEIIGLPLDGNGGRMRIMDTEDGRLDRDATYDRAVGPMQFIPTTWEEIGADADGDGVENPHSIDDAALAAGNYLCKGGRNLSVASDWWSAILSYNDVRPYAQAVFDAANKYGTDSRT
ncbi:hypothetical protein Pen02_04630 [Plantactinospora endophytica]|uniref:Transglycosylase SLT domain-containing protein n=1 Tax=Plantactinospora endophytica TaxID=673535 RepID=A0ABQ4DSV4_9ACTN|nr:hypothetical protein Pen02_04630 [Plantactinospora endophytica]